MVQEPDKVRENYLRRQAKRLGLSLQKSRAKKWSIDNQCGYMIIEPHGNLCLHGSRFDLDLEDVVEILDKREKELKD